MNLNKFIDIILKYSSDDLKILSIDENVWNNFVSDEVEKKYQIELYKKQGDNSFFSGYIFYLDRNELSLYSIDHFYDFTRRRKKVGLLPPNLEWIKKIKNADLY